VYAVTLVHRSQGKKRLFKKQRVFGADLSRQNLGAIFGRDVLQTGRLVVAFQPPMKAMGFVYQP